MRCPVCGHAEVRWTCDLCGEVAPNLHGDVCEYGGPVVVGIPPSDRWECPACGIDADHYDEQVAQDAAYDAASDA